MKVGIVGTGMISDDFMSCCRIADVEVGAVYNRTLEKAEAFREKYELEGAYDDYQAFLDSGLFNTVYIALPNSLHYQYAKEAMNSRKNVLIEKPFCSNLREFDELVAISRDKSCFLIEMDRVTSTPSFQKIKEMIPQLGKVRNVNMDYSQYSRKYDAYLEGKVANVFTTKFSGGALMDLGVYCVNLTVALFGLPNNLMYIADVLSTGVEIGGVLVFKYPGCLVNINLSKNSIGDKTINIQGEKGSLLMKGVPGGIQSIDLVTREGSSSVEYSHEYGGAAYTLMEMKRIIDSRDFEACEIRLIQSRKVIKVLDTARRSAKITFDAD